MHIARLAWLTSFTVVAACGSSPGPGDNPGAPDSSVPNNGSDGGGPIIPDAAIPDAMTRPALQVCASGAPYTTIGAAIAAAQVGDEIDVCAGNYPEQLVIGKKLYLKGAGAGSTTIDGQGAGTVIAVHDTAADPVAIEGFTITGGNTSATGGGVSCVNANVIVRQSTVTNNTASGAGGAGVYASNCTIELANDQFTMNTAGADGGGALLDGVNGSVHDSLFDGNTATHGAALSVLSGAVIVANNEMRNGEGRLQGGALWYGGVGEIASNNFHDNHAGWDGGSVFLYIYAGVFHDNTIANSVADFQGGGLYAHEGSPTLRHNTVTGNQALHHNGGGFRIFESMATIDSNDLENNSTPGDGGGMKVSHVPTLMTNNIIKNNAAGAGGGLEMDNDASTLRGGEISGNTASSGGGIYIDEAPWNGAVLDGVNVHDNHAYWKGGGIEMTGNVKPVTLHDVTIVNNHSDSQGGGIFVASTEYHISHTLIAHNSAPTGGAIFHAQPAPYNDPLNLPLTPTNGTLSYSVLDGNTASNGSAIYAETDGLSVDDTIVYDHQGMAVSTTAQPIWSYNDTMPATFSGMNDPSGSNGNLSADPGFVDAANGDYHLAAGSACIDAGDPTATDPDGSRADIGLYGGPQ